MIEALADQIKSGPHWRILVRPADYKSARLHTLPDCMAAVEQAQVRLRGWSFPHLPRNSEQQESGQDYVAAGSDFMSHLEYWRFYQSGQFLGLYSVREATEAGWADKLHSTARGHYGRNASLASGYFDLLNFMYNVAEVYEFASRLCQRGIHDGPDEIEIGIVKAKGFGLLAGPMRYWDEQYTLSVDELFFKDLRECADLVSGGAEPALESSLWFFERFGWLEPPVEVLRSDIQKFLERRL